MTFENDNIPDIAIKSINKFVFDTCSDLITKFIIEFRDYQICVQDKKGELQLVVDRMKHIWGIDPLEKKEIYNLAKNITSSHSQALESGADHKQPP